MQSLMLKYFVGQKCEGARGLFLLLHFLVCIQSRTEALISYLINPSTL